jgi:hypothetical protein
MTVADPRLLEAAFVCVSIIVRKCVILAGQKERSG